MEKKKKTFYISTPIYYPNDNLHIGHAYCSTIADTISRYKKMKNYDVFFHTGTDEHGQKIEQTAKAKKMTPKAYVDEIIVGIKNLWELMDIDYDIFYRTTDQKHMKAVQQIFKRLYEQGDIYKGHYEGLYCTPCETFFTKFQLIDGKCPDCGRDVHEIKEEAYFFRLSKYEPKIRKLLENGFLKPQFRANEIIHNFLDEGLEDLCVSRTSFTWGIPVDFDPNHIVYVWIDALSNYITALGYLSLDNSLYQKFWPGDLHLIGKDIMRFHAVIWPAILMALGEELPKQVYATGFIIIGGNKMSKSLGNVVDPYLLSKRYGVDALRYFLLRESGMNNDTNYSNEILIKRINADLVNDLGNLLSRTVGMIEKYFGGSFTVTDAQTQKEEELLFSIAENTKRYEKNMDNYQINEALKHVWQIIGMANKYIDENKPWELVKQEKQQHVLSKVLYNLCEVLRIVSILISPCMPSTPALIYEALQLPLDRLSWDHVSYEFVVKQIKVKKTPALFPRLDLKEELDYLEQLNKQTQASSNALLEQTESFPSIGIEDIEKIELKIGRVIDCKPHPNANKLLISQIDLKDETRQIISGIATSYTPDMMIGKEVVVVCNLKPIKLRGEMSNGMILAAKDQMGNFSIVLSDQSNFTGCPVE